MKNRKDLIKHLVCYTALLIPIAVIVIAVIPDISISDLSILLDIRFLQFLIGIVVGWIIATITSTNK